MILWIRNIFRKIRGRPPVSNLSMSKEDCYTTQETFDEVAKSHMEVLLICISHPRNNFDNSAEIKCYAKLTTDESIIRDIVHGGMINELLDGEE